MRHARNCQACAGLRPVQDLLHGQPLGLKPLWNFMLL